MVAYSFQDRFVRPIQVGLGLTIPDDGNPVDPKTQTIREEGKRRHARPGDDLQLYRGMRTKNCYLIGRAVCTEVHPIRIRVDDGVIAIGPGIGWTLRRNSELDEFARKDGFKNYIDFAEFWNVNHPRTMNSFRGVLIRWKASAS